MAISNIHYPCSVKGCKESVSQKAHEWCKRNNMPDTCFDHQNYGLKNFSKGIKGGNHV